MNYSASILKIILKQKIRFNRTPLNTLVLKINHHHRYDAQDTS